MNTVKSEEHELRSVIDSLERLLAAIPAASEDADARFARFLCNDLLQCHFKRLRALSGNKRRVLK